MLCLSWLATFRCLQCCQACYAMFGMSFCGLLFTWRVLDSGWCSCSVALSTFFMFHNSVSRETGHSCELRPTWRHVLGLGMLPIYCLSMRQIVKESLPALIRSSSVNELSSVWLSKLGKQCCSGIYSASGFTWPSSQLTSAHQWSPRLKVCRHLRYYVLNH